MTAELAKYRVSRALRPFSFVVALLTCALGVLLAWLDGYPSWPRAALVLGAGLLLQAGVNLINDHGDLDLLPGLSDAQRRLIRRNFRWGLLCMLAAAAGAAVLVWLSGWPLLLLVVLGAVGALGYTTEPINYKRRGLGVVLAFWLMGVLMVAGAYLAMSGRWSLPVLALSMPLSLLTALLLLGNELRDWESDREQGIGTLTVRLGFRAGQGLYLAIVALTYLCALWLYQAQLLPTLMPLAPSLLLIPLLVRALQGAPEARRRLPPFTGRFFALFGLGYLVAVSGWAS
ncbi:prenyltransferase [Motiliproteus sp. SC1-56]|uniref:prenyltransferase n=1 Tax=Motiliproteus sp. SC1-56 TaxID=2799565 RepID=UPI001A8CD6E5|nr:prenyltransferase [Motiliproteus sp. SC1-56]